MKPSPSPAAPIPSHHDARDLPHELLMAADELALLVERALRLPERPDSWWHRAGMSPRAERWLEVVSSLVLATIAVAWLWSIVAVRSGALGDDAGGETALTPTTRAVTAALTSADAPSAAYLTDAALDALTPLRGASGKLRVVVRAPGESLATALPAGTSVAVGGPAASTHAPRSTELPKNTTLATPRPGVWQIVVRAGDVVRPVSDLNVITLRSLSERRRGRLGLYYVGRWPTEGKGAARHGAAARGDYSAPRGLIEVTPQNQDTRLSEHLRLRDFLPHDQQGVWPKYVVVQTRLVDKLELVLDDLARRGIRPEGVHVMSGFRTPQYNAGVGDTRGRAGLSRHMYGDAADVWIDNDGDGRMDDLNRDGRVNVRDAEVIRAAVDRVEAAHPELVGGVGVYPATPAHGPFTHVDARGFRARWLGSGDGG